MRLLNLESLRRWGADLPAVLREHLDAASSDSAPAPRARLLKGRREDVSHVMDLCKVMGVSFDSVCRELIRYSRNTLPMDRRLPEDPETLGLLPVERLTQLEIPVLAFQETDVHEIHRATCTGALRFRNHSSRNDWVWIQVGTKEVYGALRGRIPGKLLALFKIRDYTRAGEVRRLAGVQLLSPVNGGRPSDIHGLVTVKLRENSRELTIVDIGTILGLAHLIPEADRCWLVNSHIDLRTFNDIY